MRMLTCGSYFLPRPKVNTFLTIFCIVNLKGYTGINTADVDLMSSFIDITLIQNGFDGSIEDVIVHYHCLYFYLESYIDAFYKE